MFSLLFQLIIVKQRLIWHFVCLQSIFIWVYFNLVYIYECIEISTVFRGVHQTAQTAKTTPKPSTKWHNRTILQITVHRITPHCMVQCGLRFYNKKIAQTAPHRTAPFYILIYLIIFNIKYIINSLITLVFPKKKKSLIILASVD